MDEKSTRKRESKEILKIALLLTTVIFVVEILGGALSNSLALYSDAGHVLMDIFSLGLGLFAVYQTEKPPDSTKTFGYYRTEILVALVNAVTLMMIALVITVEAYFRFQSPEHLQPLPMFISASIGILINLYIGFKLEKGSSNLNMKAVALHVFGDVGSSVGVIIAGILILITKVTIFDPVLSVVIALLIAIGAYRVLKETTNVLLEAVPNGISIEEVKQDIHKIPKIEDIHDLHIWTISSDKYALACHILVEDIAVHQTSEIVMQIKDLVRSKYNITHTTVEFECTKNEDIQCLENTL